MSIFKAIQDLAHKKEMRESKDEILFGEIIRYIIINYGPLVELETMLGDRKRAKFRLLSHHLLHSLHIELNRHTGSGLLTDATIGSYASITMTAEVKKYVADPDDALEMYKTAFSNIAKIPLLGGIKIRHQMNSIFAIKMEHFKIGDVIENQIEERKNIGHQIESMIKDLCDQLKDYKK
ncbi:MAG: hypothetical protein AB1782_19870 [Cyanobacteriota bacterium]